MIMSYQSLDASDLSPYKKIFSSLILYAFGVSIIHTKIKVFGGIIEDENVCALDGGC